MVGLHQDWIISFKITENAIYIERHVRIPITYTPGETMENHGKKNILFCLNKISRDSQSQLLSIEIFEDANFTT